MIPSLLGDFSRWKSINADSEPELAYWALQFSCSHAQLLDAMSSAGIMVVDIRAAVLKITEAIRSTVALTAERVAPVLLPAAAAPGTA